MGARLACRTLGTLAPDCGNAVLLLHGTRSGRQSLQPAFAGAMFGPGGPLDPRSHVIVLPNAIGHVRIWPDKIAGASSGRYATSEFRITKMNLRDAPVFTGPS